MSTASRYHVIYMKQMVPLPDLCQIITQLNIIFISLGQYDTVNKIGTDEILF